MGEIIGREERKAIAELRESEMYRNFSEEEKKVFEEYVKAFIKLDETLEKYETKREKRDEIAESYKNLYEGIRERLGNEDYEEAGEMNMVFEDASEEVKNFSDDVMIARTEISKAQNKVNEAIKKLHEAFGIGKKV